MTTLTGSIDSIALYRPLRMVVTNVTNASPCTITTQISHQYGVGDVLRLLIPDTYGMSADRQVRVLSVPTPLTLTADFDTSLLDAFVIPMPLTNPAQLIPMSQSVDNIYDNPPVNPVVFIVQLT